MKQYTIEIRFRDPTRCARCGGELVAPTEITCVPRQVSDVGTPLVIMDHYHARCAPIEEPST